MMSWSHGAVTENRAMEIDMDSSRHRPHRLKPPSAKWFKEWVPQETVINNGKCYVLKWVTEESLRALKEKQQEKEHPEPEPVAPKFFLCSYDGCGKTFTDAGALRKHSHVHGEKQYVCHYDGCGKKFLDSSKLKRHFLTHTGEKHFICPHEGCGKAFSLDFNLRAHMRTHSQENYHICPFEDCGKRYAHEYKLKAHIKSAHEKNLMSSVKVQQPQPEREVIHPKGSAFCTGPPDRPYVCPYEGCDKSYIHEYKLNLHLKREHAGEVLEENGRRESQSENDMDQESDQDTNVRNVGMMPPSARGKLRLTPCTTTNQNRKLHSSVNADLNANSSSRKPVGGKEPINMQSKQEDSEETEDQEETDNEGFGNGSESNDEDEETEDDME